MAHSQNVSSLQKTNFLFLGKAGGCSCSCAGAPATSSGTFAQRCKGQRVSGATAVIPSFRKHQNKLPKTQSWRGWPCCALDSRHSI